MWQLFNNKYYILLYSWHTWPMRVLTHIVGSFEFFDITVCNGTANNVRLKNYGNNSVTVK